VIKTGFAISLASRLLPLGRLMHDGAQEAGSLFPCWRARLEASAQIQKVCSMAKVLIIQPFHANGMALLEARGDVETEVVDGRSEAELADKIRTPTPRRSAPRPCPPR
jgi:hypothetical protein